MNIEESANDMSQDGYFGLSFTEMRPNEASLMQNALGNPNHANIYFRQVDFSYDEQHLAFTVEGIADSPEFALNSLIAHRELAHEIGHLMHEASVS